MTLFYMQFSSISFFLLFAMVPLATETPDSKKSDIELFSEYIGYTMGQEMRYLKGSYDLEAVIKGLRAYETGEGCPLQLNENEELQKIHEVQREQFEKLAANNLKNAEEFLRRIATEPHIQTLEKERLYFEIVNKGKHVRHVEPHTTCQFHCIVVTLDDLEIINTRHSNMPKDICLDDCISGFMRGVEGMQEGERRKLYIHPDLAYRSTDDVVPPQSLIIIDVEVVHINPS